MDRKDYQRVAEVPGKLEGIHNSSGSVGTSMSQTHWENFLTQLWSLPTVAESTGRGKEKFPTQMN